MPEPSPSIAPPSSTQSALANGRPARLASRSPISWSPSRSYLPPQPLKPKPCARRSFAAAEHDRSGIAQPDVAERLDDDLGEGREPARGFGRAFMRRDQPHLLALAAGMHRLGEGSDFALGRLQVAEPQLGIARESRSTPPRAAPIPGAAARSVRMRAPLTGASARQAPSRFRPRLPIVVQEQPLLWLIYIKIFVS